MNPPRSWLASFAPLALFAAMACSSPGVSRPLDSDAPDGAVAGAGGGTGGTAGRAGAGGTAGAGGGTAGAGGSIVGGAGMDGGIAGGAGGSVERRDGGTDVTVCNTASDVSNCGRCGQVCPGPRQGSGTPTCTNGRCGLDCGALTLCGDACIDTTGNGSHCGSCNMPCGAGMVCRMGKCATTCNQGLTACGTTCVDLSSSADNCKTCGNKCPGPTSGAGAPACQASACEITCAGVLKRCGTACVNQGTDVNNCGSCGNKCAGPSAGAGTAVCAGGLCGLDCAGTLTACGGACIDTTSNRNHCGSCGKACPANADCVKSGSTAACVCGPGTVLTGSTCTAEDECATGNQRCGGVSGTCTGGAAAGYSCNCAAGYTNSGGMFPQCTKSGTLTVGPATYAYRFTTGTVITNFDDGDFYMSSGDEYSNMWGNNAGQHGLLRVESSAPLAEVPVPSSGYDRFGVPLVVGGTYVLQARDPDVRHFIVFRVVSSAGMTKTLDWLLVYR